jgi:hypothetical protein
MADVPKDIMEALTTYVLRYGGMCRDCADENGTCPHSGMPCDPDVCRPVVRRTIKALAYGIEHGFIASPFLSERERRTAQGVTVPAGWKLVPIEPTEEMITAGRLARMNIEGGYGGPGPWEAMLAAAPSLSTSAGGAERG